MSREGPQDRYTFCNGVVLHRSQVELLFGNRWLNSIDRLSQIFATMDIDISAFGCLCALSLVTGKKLPLRGTFRDLDDRLHMHSCRRLSNCFLPSNSYKNLQNDQ